MASEVIVVTEIEGSFLESTELHFIERGDGEIYTYEECRFSPETISPLMAMES